MRIVAYKERTRGLPASSASRSRRRLTSDKLLCRIHIMKSFAFKIYPNKHTRETFERWLDGCRELYNAGLQERRDAYRKSHTSINYHMQSAQLPDVKRQRPDIAEINAQVLQDTLRRLSKAFDAFFRRVKAGETPGYPRFKGKHRFHSFTFPQNKDAFRIEGKYLWLSKIGRVKIKQHRPITGEIKTCTITREPDGWYAIFAAEENQSPWFPKTGETVGIDVGLTSFATLSTGEEIPNPQYFRQAERRLKTAQRRVSRCIKGSHRRKQAVTLLAKQHQKIARQRQDFFHKTSLSFVKSFDHAVFEDLNINGMVKNHHMAKSIADAAWGTFITLHFAKAEKAGRTAEKVNPYRTSQDCADCGSQMKLSLAQRVFRCTNCGSVKGRDHNASLNIQKRGGTAFSEGEGHVPRRPEYFSR
jgi:putative transposase